MRDIILVFGANGVGGAEKNLIRLLKPGSRLFNLGKPSEELSELCRENGIGLDPSISFNIRELFIAIKNTDLPIYYISNRASFLLLFYSIVSKVKRSRLFCGVRWNPTLRQRRDWVFYFIENLSRTRNYIYNCQASLATSKRFLKLKGSLRHILIYNNINVDISPYEPLLTCNNISLVTAANLSSRKGYISALPLIDSIDSITEWRIFGKDYSNGRIPRCLERSKKVKNKGYSSRWIESLERENSVFFLPSKYGEGVPTVLVEAMARKTFIIAFAVDGVPELLTNYSRALLLDPRSNLRCQQNQIGEFIQSHVENRVRSNSCEILGSRCWNSFYEKHEEYLV